MADPATTDDVVLAARPPRPRDAAPRDRPPRVVRGGVVMLTISSCLTSGVSFVGFCSPSWLGDALSDSWEGSGSGDGAFSLTGLTSPEAGDTGEPGDLKCAG